MESISRKTAPVGAVVNREANCAGTRFRNDRIDGFGHRESVR